MLLDQHNLISLLRNIFSQWADNETYQINPASFSFWNWSALTLSSNDKVLSAIYFLNLVLWWWTQKPSWGFASYRCGTLQSPCLFLNSINSFSKRADYLGEQLIAVSSNWQHTTTHISLIPIKSIYTPEESDVLKLQESLGSNLVVQWQGFAGAVFL